MKAFTLVELIVVITILAILWTIAFISLQWYSRDARDSTRTADLWNIKTSLELYTLQTWKYPSPDSFSTITYSWWTEKVWYQWVVWDGVTKNLKSLNEKPLDPLTNDPYVYSTTNSYKEYEVLALYEWSVAYNPIINQTNAATTQLTPKIDWNYNWVFVKTTNYIIPSPSLITAEPLTPWIWTLLTSSNIKSLVTTNGKNIPKNTLTKTKTWALNINLSVYTWSITKTSTSTEKVNAMKQIQNAYTWTTLATDNAIATVLNSTTNSQLLVLSSTTFKLPPASLDWSCWSDNGWNLISSPTNSCTIWSISNLVDNWQWNTYTWSCDWSNWWASTTCSANHLTAINWTCWTSAWLNLTTAPISNLCNTWTLSGTVLDNWQWNTYAWSCNWSNWWTNSSCAANNINSTYPWCSIPDIHYSWHTISWCNVWATNPSWYWSLFNFNSKACPVWYHVPSSGELIVLKNANTAWILSLPKGGYNDPYWLINQRGSLWYYWSTLNSYKWWLEVLNTYNNISYDIQWTYWSRYSVRCFKG